VLEISKSYPLKMDSLPSAIKHDAHVWVDFIELLCLVNIDRTAVRGDVLDRVRSFDDDLPEGVDPDTDETNDDSSLEDAFLENSGISDHSPAATNDKWAGYADGWFRHLSYRSKAFHEAYPFTLASTADVLQLKENLTAAQKLYIFLLLCANLRYCIKSKSALTKTFEQLSKEAMKSFLSNKAEVYIFGTSETDDKKYSGNLYQKIEKLAKDLGEIVTAKESDFPPSDTGDGGLDLVAWVSMGDTNSHRMVVFGQCACTDEWPAKQHSSGADRWRGHLTLSSGITNVLFIPHCFRGADGEWHKKSDISSVMVDRQRFLFALAGQENLLETKAAFSVVQKAITQTEDIY
jgi:hypothetical protein